MYTLSFYFQVLINGFVLSCFYILVALGLNLIMGVMHIVNFAQGTVYMLSTMLLHPLRGLGLLFAGRCSFHRGDRALGCFHGASLLQATLREIPPELGHVPWAMLAIGAVWLRFGIILDPSRLCFMGHSESLGFCLLRALSGDHRGLLLIGGLFVFIRHTKAGQAIRAVEQDREAAILHGIEIPAMCRLVFL
jgi:ABC-type branched-subunit amino acid transport system permease subunit